MRKTKVIVIAEIGVNHNGSISLAKKLINIAKKSGANYVKFQTFKTENFIRKIDKKRFNQLKKFELSYKQFKLLSELLTESTNDREKIIKSDKKSFPSCKSSNGI